MLYMFMKTSRNTLKQVEVEELLSQGGAVILQKLTAHKATVYHTVTVTGVNTVDIIALHAWS